MADVMIPKSVSLECHHCGHVFDAVLKGWGLIRREKCPECGGIVGVRVDNSIEGLLDALGVRISLDWDGQLIASSDAIEIPDGLIGWLAQNQFSIRQHIEAAARAEMAVFVGGPFNGKKHHEFYTKKVVSSQVRRSHWAVYEFRTREDPRMYFIGFATSRANAKKKILKEGK